MLHPPRHSTKGWLERLVTPAENPALHTRFRNLAWHAIEHRYRTFQERVKHLHFRQRFSRDWHEVENVVKQCLEPSGRMAAKFLQGDRQGFERWTKRGVSILYTHTLIAGNTNKTSKTSKTFLIALGRQHGENQKYSTNYWQDCTNSNFTHRKQQRYRGK